MSELKDDVFEKIQRNGFCNSICNSIKGLICCQLCSCCMPKFCQGRGNSQLMRWVCRLLARKRFSICSAIRVRQKPTKHSRQGLNEAVNCMDISWIWIRWQYSLSSNKSTMVNVTRANTMALHQMPKNAELHLCWQLIAICCSWVYLLSCASMP